MKKNLSMFLLATTIALTISGCNKKSNSNSGNSSSSESSTTESSTSSEHVHQINEYGECETCGEYLGNYPTLFPTKNVVPALKAHECYFYRTGSYAGHTYNCDHLSDYTDFSYEETSWYGHNSDGYTFITTNKFNMEVDNEGKIDGKTYDFLLFKIEASKDHADTASFDYYIHHNADHFDEVKNCLYDNIYAGIELNIGVSSGDFVEGNQKLYYRFHIEENKSYLLGLTTSGGEDIAYYYTVKEHQYEETSWGTDQPKAFLSSDDYIYIVITAPSGGLSVMIGIYEA